MSTVTERAFNFLVGHGGMQADRDLMKLFDVESFDRDPKSFLRDAVQSRPWAFGLADHGPIDVEKSSRRERVAYCNKVAADEREIARRSIAAKLTSMGNAREMTRAQYGEAKRLLARL